MIHKILSDLGGVGLFGVISICVFFAVFVGSLIFTARLRKPHVNEMAMLPLDDNKPKTATIRLETRDNGRFKTTRVMIKKGSH